MTRRLHWAEKWVRTPNRLDAIFLNRFTVSPRACIATPHGARKRLHGEALHEGGNGGPAALLTIRASPRRYALMQQDFHPLDMSWVATHLAVGGRFPLEAVDTLARASIRHVVDLRDEGADDDALLRNHGIELLWLPTPGVQPVSLPMIQRGVAWIRPLLLSDEKVFIHCENGIGRGPLLTCCVLVSLGYPPLEALKHVKDARPQASPSREQLAALIDWAKGWREENGLDWPEPTVDDLSRIAYRHLSSY